MIDDTYLFTGDTIWFGPDGGYCFLSSLAEDNKLAVKSLAVLEEKLRSRGLNPMVITGHTGWHDNLDFVFAHRDQLCHDIRKQKPHAPDAPWDGYDESDDTEEKARTVLLKKQKWMKDNIASYHHERWDGTGYPKRLAGKDIPLEARIMAIADVYDALVSKRCYKEEFDFGKAYNIIMDGMGSQFDPGLRECFCACVPELEAYYTELKRSEEA